MVDLLDLELAGVIRAADLGGIHLESWSHLSFFLVGLADLGDLGDLIHLEVSGGGLFDPDGHCHDDGVAGAGVGGDVGVVAAIL